MTPDDGRAGVMIVRIGVEQAHERSLRARLTESSDLSSPEQTTRTAASVEEVVEIVRRWAEQFAEPLTARGNPRRDRRLTVVNSDDALLSPMR